MKEVLNYKDLPVVQRSFELVREIDAFVKTLPPTPQGRTIGDQLFRAASSIGANIAEGRGRDLGKEYERFLRIARSSANETDYWLRVAHDCNLLHEDSYHRMIDLVDQCLRILSTMIKRLRNQRQGTDTQQTTFHQSGPQHNASREHPATYTTDNSEDNKISGENDEINDSNEVIEL